MSQDARNNPEKYEQTARENRLREYTPVERDDEVSPDVLEELLDEPEDEAPTDEDESEL